MGSDEGKEGRESFRLPIIGLFIQGLKRFLSCDEAALFEEILFCFVIVVVVVEVEIEDGEDEKDNRKDLERIKFVLNLKELFLEDEEWDEWDGLKQFLIAVAKVFMTKLITV